MRQYPVIQLSAAGPISRLPPSKRGVALVRGWVLTHDIIDFQAMEHSLTKLSCVDVSLLRNGTNATLTWLLLQTSLTSHIHQGLKHSFCPKWGLWCQMWTDLKSHWWALFGNHTVYLERNFKKVANQHRDLVSSAHFILDQLLPHSKFTRAYFKSAKFRLCSSRQCLYRV